MGTKFFSNIGFVFFVGVLGSSAAWSITYQPYNVPILHSLSVEDQKMYDHASESVYLYPQAFQVGTGDIAAFKMRVCAEWTEPSQAYLPPRLNPSQMNNGDSYYTAETFPYIKVPYVVSSRVHGEYYGQLARPGFCRKFKEVTVPTAEAVLKNIELQTTTGDSNIYKALSKIDLDLDRRIKALMTSEMLMRMRKEMEAQVKKELMEGPFVAELTKQITAQVKLELKRESDN